jgi:polygalacturonase
MFVTLKTAACVLVSLIVGAECSGLSAEEMKGMTGMSDYISGAVCTVDASYGNNDTLATDTIQNTIDHCCSIHPDGATVIIPSGSYRVGSIQLRSNLRLHLAPGAGLYGSANVSDWSYSLMWFGGLQRYNFRALLFGHNLTNVAVTGSNSAGFPGNTSIVDGVGWTWWCKARCMPIMQPWCAQFNPNNETLPTDMLPAPAGPGRPTLINFWNSTNITIAGFTAQHSPNWSVHVQTSLNVVIQNMTVLSPRAVGNTDGIDPESSVHVLITDSYVSVGDDAVSIKSYNYTSDAGENIMAPCQDIVMRRLHLVHRNWCIGSGTFGGVSDVLFEDSIIGAVSDDEEVDSNPVPWALKFKSHQYQPGPIANITVRNIQIGKVGATPWMYPTVMNDTHT